MDTAHPTPVLTGINYVTGEQRHPYSDLTDFPQALQRHGLANDPNLWGWGTYRRTEKPLASLFIETARHSLDTAGCEAGDIDALILCAAQFPATIGEHAALSGRVADGLGVQHARCFGVTLNRCASMLSALAIAADLVRSGAYRNVLVATADKITDERERIDRFAIFSDCASSCIVTSSPARGGPANGYELLRSAQQSCNVETITDGGVGGGLARAANDRLFAGPEHAFDRRQVARVFHDNLFLPIIVMREQMAGFAKHQLFLANIPDKAHCFASDALINLTDCAAGAPFRTGEHVVLASSTPGLRVALLVRCL